MSEAPVKSEVETFVWEPPGRGVRAVTHWSVAERIRLDVLRAAPHNRAIGGILLGRTEVESGFRCFYVEGVEPLPWTGALSAAGRGQMEEALARHNGRAIGYFRSQGVGDLFLHAGDLVLIKSLFPRDTSLFVLAKRSGDDSVTTRFGFWQNGVIVSEPGDASLPFGRPAPGASSAPAPAAVPVPYSVAPLAPYAAEPQSPPGRVLAWSLAGLLIAGAITAAALYYQPLRNSLAPDATVARQTPVEDRRTHLKLQVEKRAADMVVTWDVHSPAVEKAQRATLAVDDGGIARVFDLDATQVRTGRVYYTPMASDVAFRLEVYDDINRQTAESVRVLGAGGYVPPPAPTAATLPPRPEPAPSRPAPAPVAAEADRREPLRPYVPPPSRPTQPEPVTVAAPPDIQPNGPAPVAAVPGVPRIAAAPLPPLRIPAALPAAPAAAPTPAPAPVQRVSTYVPARPVREVQPAIPANVRSMITSPVDIQIRASIDAFGKVTRVAVVSQNGFSSGFLTESAMLAARNWRFEPARNDGRPIPSEAVLNFRFIR